MSEELPRQVIEEIERQHEMLQTWIGSRCDPHVLQDLRSVHAPDFAMVTTEGERVELDDLMQGLSHAGNAQPGLTIEVTDIKVVAETPDLVVATFTEIHSGVGTPASRRVTALFLPDSSAPHGLLWRHLHETMTASGA